LYGVVDAGLNLIDNGSATSASMKSGIISGSQFGLRGTEDLGSSLRAVFQLEASFESNSGAYKPYFGDPSSATAQAPNGAPGKGFNRRAFVGLEGRYGMLQLGRDYTPLYWAVLDSDPLKLGSYGNMQQIVLLSGTGSDRFGRTSNAAFYTSPRVAGLRGRLMASLGPAAARSASDGPPRSASRMIGASVDYTQHGLTLNGAYQLLRLPEIAGSPAAYTGATGLRRDMLVGLKYASGDYTAAGGYFRVRHPGRSGDGSDIWVGASLRLGAGVLAFNVQRMRQDVPGRSRPGEATVLGLSYIHALSRRFSLYASYGMVNNGANAAFSLLSSDTAVAPAARGEDIRALGVGMRYVF
jgi:predicted porin